jgi:hypothetical protein
MKNGRLLTVGSSWASWQSCFDRTGERAPILSFCLLALNFVFLADENESDNDWNYDNYQTSKQAVKKVG